MIKLEDCGSEVHLSDDTAYPSGFDARIIMVIKAPRGTATIFEMLDNNYKMAGEGIRAFMEEHRRIRDANT